MNDGKEIDGGWSDDLGAQIPDHADALTPGDAGVHSRPIIPTPESSTDSSTPGSITEAIRQTLVPPPDDDDDSPEINIDELEKENAKAAIIQWLTDIIFNNSDPEKVIAALILINNFEDAEVSGVIMAGTINPDDKVKEMSAKLIVKREPSESSLLQEILFPHLTDKSGPIFTSIQTRYLIDALSRLQGESAITALTEIVDHHTDSLIKSCALEALKEKYPENPNFVSVSLARLVNNNTDEDICLTAETYLAELIGYDKARAVIEAGKTG
jgi:hypothetical protein